MKSKANTLGTGWRRRLKQRSCDDGTGRHPADGCGAREHFTAVHPETSRGPRFALFSNYVKM